MESRKFYWCKFYVGSTGRVGIGTTSPATSLDLSAKTDGINMPRGTTAQQPACGAGTAGNMRYNSQTTFMEFCDGSSWNALPKLQPTAPPTTPVGTGFFVLTNSTWNGNLGGILGANAKCLTELTTTYTDWAGYADANSRGLLVPSKVRALLCDNGNCNTGIPLATYYFATAGSPGTGGASFTVNASGNGPNDSAIWSAANRFGVSTNYWSGYWGSASTTIWETLWFGYNCTSYTSSNGGTTGAAGDTGTSNGSRWGSSTPSCASTLPLICFVDP